MRRAGMAGALAVLGLATPAWAETVIPADSYDVATWTEAGSPYIVTGDVSFTELRVEAGTHVLVTSADPRITISVTTLTVNGTRDKPVTFEPESPEAAPRWRGIFVATNSGMATLNYARITGASAGLEIWGGNVVTVMGSIFEGNTSGVESYGGVLFEVDSTQFLNNANGLMAKLGDEVFVDNSLFAGNELNGLHCLGAITCRVKNSTFDGNRYALFTNGGVEVESSIFSNNELSIGSLLGGLRSSIHVAYSDFWQNDARGHADVEAEAARGEGNLYEDPQYVAPGDYRLSPSSPCIDAAANGPDHDLDGTPRPLDTDALPDEGDLRFDMGAYEYNPNPDSTGGSGGAGGAAGGASGEAGEGNEGPTGGADADDGGAFNEGFGGSSEAGSAGPTGVSGAAMDGSLTGDAGLAEALTGGSGGAAPSDPSLVRQSVVRESTGCGCRQLGPQRSGGAWLFGLMLMGLLAAGRHRRANASVR